MTQILVGMIVLATVGVPDDLAEVSARIAADRLVVGESYEMIIDISLRDGYSASVAGIPAPLLQIEVPSCVVLKGKVLKGHRELARNEYLREPFERMLSELPARIGFDLKKKPGPNDAFGLNILAYVGATSGDDAFFVRRRLNLKVAGGAKAEVGESGVSTWGKEKLLQLGDEAAPFKLPKADGKKVDLAKYRGKKSVIVTTYRAHW
ncbi:MAG: hypothetical protein IH987_14025 [Planctomycetes bacterium]|nr:hypothetical protein [Planctomycetota bacterium]